MFHVDGNERFGGTETCLLASFMMLEGVARLRGGSSASKEELAGGINAWDHV